MAQPAGGPEGAAALTTERGAGEAAGSPDERRAVQAADAPDGAEVPTSERRAVQGGGGPEGAEAPTSERRAVQGGGGPEGAEAPTSERRAVQGCGGPDEAEAPTTGRRATERRAADRILLDAGRDSAWRTAAVGLLGLASAGLGLALPFALGHALDLLLRGGTAAGWVTVCALLVAGQVAAGAAGDLLGAVTTARATARIRRRAVRHMLDAGPRTAVSGTGDLVTRLVGNASDAGAGPIAAVAFPASLAGPVGGIVALGLTDPWLAVAFLAGAPSLTLLVRRFARASSDSIARYQDAQGRIATRLVEALGGARTIAAAGTEARENARILTPLPELSAQGHRMWHVQGRATAQAAILVPLLQITVLSVAGLRLSAGALTLGELLAASRYVTLATGIGSVVGQLGALIRARTSATRIATVLAVPAPPYGPPSSAVPRAPGDAGVPRAPGDGSGSPLSPPPARAAVVAERAVPRAPGDAGAHPAPGKPTPPIDAPGDAGALPGPGAATPPGDAPVTPGARGTARSAPPGGRPTTPPQGAPPRGAGNCATSPHRAAGGSGHRAPEEPGAVADVRLAPRRRDQGQEPVGPGTDGAGGRAPEGRGAVSDVRLAPRGRDQPPPAGSRRRAPVTSAERGTLELRSVTARRAGEPVLADLNLTVPGGTSLAIVGKSGAGKSVLASLAGRLTDPDGGLVLLDGHPLPDLSREALRAAITYAFERPVLLGDTIGDAIAFGPHPLPAATVTAAARAAEADSFIRLLPDGYATPRDRAPLSGGEVQRLGLARAFAHPGRLLILDDATSSLDTVTELRVARALFNDHPHRTRLLTTHRASTAARADLVAWLVDGRIRALAPHAELWPLPDYRALFAADAEAAR